jgi:hypothetical protein
MSKRTAIILAVASLIIGAVIGALAAADFYGRAAERTIISSLTAETCTTLSTLKFVRAGKFESALELQEIKLDGDLTGLGVLLPDSRELKEPMYLKTVHMAQDYRVRFPRGNNLSPSASGTAKAFNLLKKQTDP